MDTMLADMDVSLVSGILVTVFCLLYFCYQIFDKGGKPRYPPGPTGIPFLGSLLSLILSKKPQHELVNDWTEKYGDLFFFKLLNIRVYMVSDARLSHCVMGSQHAAMKMPVPLVKTLTGKENVGMSYNNGEVWQEQRRFFLQSVYKKSDVGGIRYDDVIADQMERLLIQLDQSNGKSFDPRQAIDTAIGNIILTIITGVSYEYGDPEFRRIKTLAIRLFELLGPGGLLTLLPIQSLVPSSSAHEMAKAWEEILDFVRGHLQEHKSRFDPSRKATDFIDMYLQEMLARESRKNDEGFFHETNLLVVCFDAILAGMETTATSIAWILHTLASYPEAQRRVHQEIIDVVGHDRFPNLFDRSNLPVTMATIAECRRFRPTVAIVAPHVVTNDCKIGDYDVKKGSVVATNMWHMAQSPSLWDDPQEFRPDRFLNADGTNFDSKKEPISFGTGQRSCPGQQLARTEIFLFVAYVCQGFNIKLAEGVPKDLPSQHSITNQPDPYQIHAVRIIDGPISNNNKI